MQPRTAPRGGARGLPRVARRCGVAIALALLAAAAPPTEAAPAAPAATLAVEAAARFAALALKCLHQEYPNHISHTLNSAADARPPHELTPAFYGCLASHSDVH